MMSALSEALSPRFFVGLDVGGTKIEALVVDQLLAVRGKTNLPTDTSSGAAVVESISGTLNQVLFEAQLAPQQVAAIGIGIPGQIQAGFVKHAVNLNLESFPLARTLSARFGTPVVLENDVRAAALGAYLYFHDREPIESMAYLGIGTGISAGVVLQGKLHRGSNGMAGEIGHAVVGPNGPRCNCGAYGCLEAVAAGPAIALQAIQVVSAGESTHLQLCHPLPAQAG